MENEDSFYDRYKKIEDKAEDFLAAVERIVPSVESDECGGVTLAQHQAILLMVYHVSKGTRQSFASVAEYVSQQLDNLREVII